LPAFFGQPQPQLLAMLEQVADGHGDGCLTRAKLNTINPVKAFVSHSN